MLLTVVVVGAVAVVLSDVVVDHDVGLGVVGVDVVVVATCGSIELRNFGFLMLSIEPQLKIITIAKKINS